jgi:hypothetical protein
MYTNHRKWGDFLPSMQVDIPDTMDKPTIVVGGVYTDNRLDVKVDPIPATEAAVMVATDKLVYIGSDDWGGYYPPLGADSIAGNRHRKVIRGELNQAKPYAHSPDELLPEWEPKPQRTAFAEPAEGRCDHCKRRTDDLEHINRGHYCHACSGPVWAGLARMAKARAGAGVDLNDWDRRALAGAS